MIAQPLAEPQSKGKMSMPTTASRIFVICLSIMLIVGTFCQTAIYWQIYGFSKLFGDFDAFYLAACHAAAHQWAAIYDVAKLRRLIAEDHIKGMIFFVNPPTGLLIIYPLGFFNRSTALLLWSLGQLSLLALALRTHYMKKLFRPSCAPALPTQALLIIAFLAFSLQNLLYGQVAVLCATLFLLVVLLRKSQPVAAGILLGIFSFKPQLGVVLPLLLLAEQNWKALIWGVLSALFLALLSFAVFGQAVWQDYHEASSILLHYIAQNQMELFDITVTVYAALRNLGLSAAPAFAAQILVTLFVLITLWPVLKRAQESDKILLLTLATFLVTPYSLIYDMVVLAVPTLLLMRKAEANLITLSELIALLFLILMPLVTVLLQIEHIPYSVIAVGFAFAVARRHMTPSLTLHG